MFSMSVGMTSGDVPGLASVATAVGTPASRSAAMGGNCVLPSVQKAPGNITTAGARLLARQHVSPRRHSR